jgi:2-polyprenyl-3-methyl-5-hydroxy-6-metoxy-1,4-benzoquinol methylase
MAGRALTRRLGLDRRSSASEIMDTEPLSAPVVDRTLGFFELTNRRFGGAGIVLRTLERWRAGWPAGAALRLLDVGTGAADIPRALLAWAHSVGVDMSITAIDSAPDVAAAARERARGVRGLSIELASLADVAASGRRFDYVTASLFLHHVTPDRTVEALASLDRLATRGVVISDLRRSWFALAGVGLLAYAAGNAVVRHDGPLSVRRAFTVEELRGLASECRLGYLTARSEGPFRVSLSGEKHGAA